MEEIVFLPAGEEEDKGWGEGGRRRVCRRSNYLQDKLLALNPLIRGFGLCKIGAADNNTITGPVGAFSGLYEFLESHTNFLKPSG
jgi:hypothetical protein